MDVRTQENRFAKDHYIVKFPIKEKAGGKLWEMIQEISELKKKLLQQFEETQPCLLGEYLDRDSRLAKIGVEQIVVGNSNNFIVPKEKKEVVDFLAQNQPRWAKVKKRLR